MKIYTEFDFLGSRTYIHSTSWLYKLLKLLKINNYISADNEIKKIDAVFRHKSDKQGYYIIDEEYEGNIGTYFNISLADRKIKAFYAEDKETVTNRISYDEDALADKCNIYYDERKASVIIDNYDTIYNVIVALNKKLLLDILPKENYTSWSVGKFSIYWDIMHNNPIGKELSVNVTNNIDNMYVKSKIYLQNEAIGSIDYARNKA